MCNSHVQATSIIGSCSQHAFKDMEVSKKYKKKYYQK